MKGTSNLRPPHLSADRLQTDSRRERRACRNVAIERNVQHHRRLRRDITAWNRCKAITDRDQPWKHLHGETLVLSNQQRIACHERISIFNLFRYLPPLSYKYEVQNNA